LAFDSVLFEDSEIIYGRTLVDRDFTRRQNHGGAFELFEDSSQQIGQGALT
jgi:hypothetical protein